MQRNHYNLLHIGLSNATNYKSEHKYANARIAGKTFIAIVQDYATKKGLCQKEFKDGSKIYKIISFLVWHATVVQSLHRSLTSGDNVAY